MYMGAAAGDLRIKGDLAAVKGKVAGAVADVTDDYCLRPRAAPLDLGALQSSLGDCPTVPPPRPSAVPDAGTSSSSSGSIPPPVDAGGTSSSGEADASASPTPPAEDDSCGCRVVGADASDRTVARAGLGLLGLLGLAAWRRRSPNARRRPR
jgi:hypothetical protein